MKERYGKDNRSLSSKTCSHCFSETHGTPFFGPNTSMDEVCRTPAEIPEKGYIRGVARSSGHDKSTISRWIDLAGKHCREVTDYFLKELCLNRVQVDEIWSFIKKERNVHISDSKEYGDVYSLTAIKPETRLFLSRHEGKRTAGDCIELFSDVERRRAIESHIPVFTSDNWDPFEEGLLNVYGFLETPPYCGIGRKPDPLLVPYPNLKYAKVCKKRKNGQLVEIIQSIVYGNPDETKQLFGVDSGGKINTAYVERLNLTIRYSLARFVRKSMNCSKILGRHTHALDFFQAWYNFAKPHKSLRLRVDQGRKKWMQRTPGMAEGLTDHIWTIKELMTFRIPVQ